MKANWRADVPVTVFALYAYDAVLALAHSLERVLAAGGDLRDGAAGRWLLHPPPRSVLFRGLRQAAGRRWPRARG
jgi:hypothetical protein